MIGREGVTDPVTQLPTSGPLDARGAPQQSPILHPTAFRCNALLAKGFSLGLASLVLLGSLGGLSLAEHCRNPPMYLVGPNLLRRTIDGHVAPQVPTNCFSLPSCRECSSSTCPPHKILRSSDILTSQKFRFHERQDTRHILLPRIFECVL